MVNAASPLHPHVAPAAESSSRKELDFASSMLESEASAVLGLRERITGRDAEAFARAVTAIVQCAQRDGTVLLTGLGKSGIIAQKISATLASLGIPSHFVHPAEAAHGDLGRFRASDICIALSYSGETDEVVTLASILHQDGVPVISITRGPRDLRSAAQDRSSLERLATFSLTIGHVDDTQGFADGGSPAPTCSTTAMLALGDVLALCAARRRNFTDEDFAKRHPGGSLGGMLRPVREILRFRVGVNVATADDSLSVEAALSAAELPGVRRPGALMLVSAASGGALTGILTDADLRRLIAKDPAAGFLKQPVRDVMTRAPGTLSDDSLVRDAVRMVRENRRDEIPVIDPGGRPVGLLDVQDLVTMRLITGEHGS